jgi:hypothetical protein
MNKPLISDYIGKYGSADSDSNAYIDAMNMYYRNNNISGTYSITQNESQQFLSHYHKKGDKPDSGGKGLISKAVSAQGFTTGYGMISSEAATELIGADKIADAAVSIGKALFGSQSLKDGLKGLFSTGLSNLYDGMVNIVNQEVVLRNKLNSQIGIGKDLSRDYRNNIVDAYDKVQGMGYSFDELADTAISATNETGRFFTMNESVMENMAVTSRAFIGDMKQMGPILRSFELTGIGAEKTLENINMGGKSSLTLGLNIRKTTEEFQKNIGKINQYGFENGVQGLNRMVQKSVEFRMNMQNVFDVAEKVMSPEKAIDLAANLQVLGGAVGSLGDPFQMMYMATNNVEGLQDALIGAAESLAVYSEANGKFEISGINLRRARAMADELGMSYQDLSNMAIAAAERTSASQDIIASGVSADEKQIEFLTNLARMGKDGKMVIEVPTILQEQLGKTIELEDLNQTTANAILENQKAFEKMDTKDIALEQFTATQQLALTVSEIAAMLKVEFARTYRGMGAEMDKYVKQADDLLKNYVKGDRSNAEINAEIDSKRKDLETKVKENTGVKTTTQPEQPRKVDNSQQTNQTQQTPQTQTNSLPLDDVERLYLKLQNASRGQTVVNNNIDPTNPNNYLYIK